MGDRTDQSRQWGGEFGRAYTDRNPRTPEAMDALHTHNFGVTRTEMNRDFLGALDPSTRILEVGANVGAQLATLQAAGFEQLYGIELQFYAIQQSRAVNTSLHLAQASAFDLPFPDASFDLVFTSGVLIHLSPSLIGRALDEVHRCARAYIWGYEYYADEYTNIDYRGHENLMWKADFAGLYCERFPSLRRAKERHYKYLQDDNVDTMFLLEKS